MNDPRFLQIHTLTGYSAALINRDDTGLAKRLPYGGVIRTRISSQCLKRHWRIADDPHSIKTLSEAHGDAIRSRSLIDIRVIDALEKEGLDHDVLAAIGQWMNYAVYSGVGKDKPKKRGQAAKADDKSKRPTLLFSEREISWLTTEARKLAQAAGNDADAAFAAAKLWTEGQDAKGKKEKKDKDEEGEGDQKQAAKLFKANIKALRDGAALPGGLAAALFGRMVTSDTAANITAPVYVAHAFTTHAEESESDYFTAVDDLSGDEPGADTIQETELNSGLFYGYVVIDLGGLRDNLGGDGALAGQVVDHLIHLIAEVSPGAKRGSTAPFGRAGLMLVEAGDRQPRSLAEAFREPTAPHLAAAAEALSAQLARYDAAYETGETRRVLSLVNTTPPGAERATLRELAAWAGGIAAGPGA